MSRLLTAAGILATAAGCGHPDVLIVKPAGSAAWHELPAINGARMRTAEVWGDPSKGAHGSLTVLPGAFVEPWHRHAYALRVVVISGVMRYGFTDSEGSDLPPGSFASIPAGLTHRGECRSSSECLVYVEQDGPMNVEPVSNAGR
jgi:anti-sigma factor ChrR (cupin superfamily)